ncbi:MAG: M14 family zinc carboxypeptidase, partial [Clostridia bacterium]
GVELCQHGLASVPQEKHEFLLKANDGSENFELWKANINAVDLNTNFFAKWGEGANNVTYPNPSDYIGKMPACEPETQALINITQKILPSVTLSYHTRGEMVYWGFETVKTYLNEAREISMLLDYPLKESTGSAGGYKDWFVACTYNLGLTVECINENTDYPIPLDVLPQLYRRHKDVLYLSEDIARRIAK